MFSASQRTSARGAASVGLSPLGTGVVATAAVLRQGLGRDESKLLRPVFSRQGMKGSKSLRAEVSSFIL